MTIELGRYRARYQDLEKHLSSRDGDPHQAIQEFAVGYHMPIIVAYCFANQILKQDFSINIEKLKYFYNIDEIVE